MFSLRNRFNLCDIKPGNTQSTGKLSVTVRNRLNKEPISFAEVSLYYLTIHGVYNESGEGDLIVRHITDEYGKVPIIELPVIDRIHLPYNQYFVTVNHFRYYPVNLMNVQIYPNVTTEYNVQLTPLTERHPEYEFHITPELIRQQKKLPCNFNTLF